MPRPRKWTDEELLEAARHSTNLLGICRRLGVPPGGRTYDQIRAALARLGDPVTPALRQVARRRGSRAWSERDLREVVATSLSFAETMRALGYQPSGGMHRYIRNKLAELRIDTSHFTGQSWANGKSFPSRARPLAEILVADSTYGGSRLRQRLIKAGLKEARCEHCGLDEWRGQRLPLTLDHINGDPRDNRLENLRILCSNCHSLTPTWCARKPKPA